MTYTAYTMLERTGAILTMWLGANNPQDYSARLGLRANLDVSY